MDFYTPVCMRPARAPIGPPGRERPRRAGGGSGVGPTRVWRAAVRSALLRHPAGLGDSIGVGNSVAQASRVRCWHSTHVYGTQSSILTFHSLQPPSRVDRLDPFSAGPRVLRARETGVRRQVGPNDASMMARAFLREHCHKRLELAQCLSHLRHGQRVLAPHPDLPHRAVEVRVGLAPVVTTIVVHDEASE